MTGKPENPPAFIYCRWQGHACDCRQLECALSGPMRTIATGTTTMLSEREKRDAE